MRANIMMGKSGKRPVSIIGVNSTLNAVNTLDLTKPLDTAAGDLMIVSLTLSSFKTITPPAGWVLIVNNSYGAIYSKIATSSEPSAYSFSAATTISGAIITFRNAKIGVLGAVNTGTNTTQTANSITITDNNSLLLAIYSAGGSYSYTYSVPSGFSQIAYDLDITRPSFSIMIKSEVNAGATGDVISTATKSLTSVSNYLLSISPN
ncbi:hypothetical protein [Sulfuricurvum sp.]|uniref:hypothetical protein n=1 Tax=Sulfuricurvum sp. TaxID=2025608 RepID=UPI002618B34E|nr:hypothetical protein [Sulfuricurvum sp.]MDD2267651.1 hypothetical protein [Sulfuricurvum sp.]MDD2784763.1 hypothetical protein [Sulfuricurvum sp.]